MQNKATSLEEYLKQIPEERQHGMHKLRSTILENLPEGFEEVMSYGMIGYVVPHEIYPPGYHCDNKLPLPFINIASQKHFIALYHMGIYADPELLDWFTTAYAKLITTKVDMGKSCIRFKKSELIPFDLIGELCEKITVKEWINTYEAVVKR
ncbi:MAG: hypothetical protein ACI8QD_002850 [Cyclobacteriaceae bacterium]|jgi:uncharacterized protein YdhG (YjbR/CyaY superfamily)